MKPVQPFNLEEGTKFESEDGRKVEVITFAKDQKGYSPLPAIHVEDGDIITEWEFSKEDVVKVMNGGKLRLTIKTFNYPLQPVMLEISENEGEKYDG